MVAVIFPGQGSQKPGMGQELYENVHAARDVFKAVQSATMADIAAICFQSDEETLRQTQNAQLALYTCGLAAYQAIRPSLPERVVFAGHSVGEYAAIVAAGAVHAEIGAKLVQKRGDLMSRAGSLRPGTMAAVLGMERDALAQACADASTADEVAVIANDNCPGQLVISGDVAAVERAGKLASERGAKRVLPLNVSGAFHSPLMEDSAQAMGEALRLASWHPQTAAVYANVTAAPVSDSGEWAGLLEAQLKSPVRWTESVERMIADGVDTFIECGAGEVLGGLVKRISKEVRTLKVHDMASLAEAQDALQAVNA